MFSCLWAPKTGRLVAVLTVLSPLLQVVRAIVPKIILDDVFTVRPQLMHSCMVNVGSAGFLSGCAAGGSAQCHCT